MTETTAAVGLHSVTKKFGEDVTAVDNVDLEIRDGEFFSLLGPSGCGKTTTLRMIAGLEYPTDGSIQIFGEEMGLRPPNKRPVNTVFQSYALFPHMNVEDNIGFGLRMQKLDKTEIRTRVGEAIDLVRLTGLNNRRPGALSGGQQQRVALARALVNRPKVLLLDEPLGALDLKLRQTMQFELHDIQSNVGITFIYVTHDQQEALTMSDRIGVMNEGRLLQVDDPEELYERPKSRFVANFIGEINLLDGTVGSGGEIELGGDLRVSGGDGLAAGTSVGIGLRPERITLHDDGMVPDGRVALPGTVASRIYHGDYYAYAVETPAGHIDVTEENRAGVQTHDEGIRVVVSWDPSASTVVVD